jgi:predicted RNA binding protein YcfA (HicA-like mRNA interferase family)
MPRKIRELIRDLEQAGFILRKDLGKGSHRVYKHPDSAKVRVTLAGKAGDDAQGYQEQQVRDAIREVRSLKNGRQHPADSRGNDHE